MNHLSIRALEEFPLINPGDNLSSIILDSIEDNDITIDDGDVNTSCTKNYLKIRK